MEAIPFIESKTVDSGLATALLVLFLAIAYPSIAANIKVEFAGRTAHYTHVELQRAAQGNLRKISGTPPITCSDFNIDRFSFLMALIKNEIPVKIEMGWRST